jgi:hypothetical protein
MIPDHIQGLVAVPGGQDLHALVGELLERLLDEQPDVLLVIDDEDRCHAAPFLVSGSPAPANDAGWCHRPQGDPWLPVGPGVSGSTTRRLRGEGRRVGDRQPDPPGRGVVVLEHGCGEEQVALHRPARHGLEGLPTDRQQR